MDQDPLSLNSYELHFHSAMEDLNKVKTDLDSAGVKPDAKIGPIGFYSGPDKATVLAAVEKSNYFEIKDSNTGQTVLKLSLNRDAIGNRTTDIVSSDGKVLGYFKTVRKGLLSPPVAEVYSGDETDGKLEGIVKGGRGWIEMESPEGMPIATSRAPMTVGVVGVPLSPLIDKLWNMNKEEIAEVKKSSPDSSATGAGIMKYVIPTYNLQVLKPGAINQLLVIYFGIRMEGRASASFNII